MIVLWFLWCSNYWLIYFIDTWAQFNSSCYEIWDIWPLWTLKNILLRYQIATNLNRPDIILAQFQFALTRGNTIRDNVSSLLLNSLSWQVEKSRNLNPWSKQLYQPPSFTVSQVRPAGLYSSLLQMQHRTDVLYSPARWSGLESGVTCRRCSGSCVYSSRSNCCVDPDYDVQVDRNFQRNHISRRCVGSACNLPLILVALFSFEISVNHHVALSSNCRMNLRE